MLLGLGFLDCHSWKVALTLWVLAFAFHAMQYSGHMVNHLDIAPRYAGLLMGLTSSLGTAAHVICHHLFDLATENVSTDFGTKLSIVVIIGCKML